MKSPKYQQRFYREWRSAGDLVGFQVQVSESDLFIRAKVDVPAAARESLLRHRLQIETYGRAHPEFLSALAPVPVEPVAPAIIRDMAAAAVKAGVGPMAAVAGAIAEYVGRDLLRATSDVIVENGGDVFLAGTRARTVGVYAGGSMPPVFLEIPVERLPCGICTSSGVLGHSLSFGRADAVTIIAASTALADAAATAAGNLIQSEQDIERGLAFALSVEGVRGALIAVNGKIGLQGEITLQADS